MIVHVMASMEFLTQCKGSIIYGTSQDISLLARVLPSYIFKDREAKAENVIVSGFSLGGHVTYMSLSQGLFFLSFDEVEQVTKLYNIRPLDICWRRSQWMSRLPFLDAGPAEQPVPVFSGERDTPVTRIHQDGAVHRSLSRKAGGKGNPRT